MGLKVENLNLNKTRNLVFTSRVGLNFDVAVEELHVTGTLQLILQMSMDVPFPHVTKATVSFTDL